MRIPPQLLGTIPQKAGDFGLIREAGSVYAPVVTHQFPFPCFDFTICEFHTTPLAS